MSTRELLDDDDRERCQHLVADSGQCRYRRVADSEYCESHTSQIAKNNKSRLEYALMGYSEKANSQNGRTAVINLRDEIAILRMSLEERLNQCNNANDVLTATPMILETVKTINTAVLSCHKLEVSLGEVLGREKLIAFADKVINLLAEAELNPEQVSYISEKLAEEF